MTSAVAPPSEVNVKCDTWCYDASHYCDVRKPQRLRGRWLSFVPTRVHSRCVAA